MRKIIALILTLTCVLGLVACSNAEPEIITKTCTGKVTSIDLDEEVLTVLDEKTNEEISFTISLLLPHSRDTAIRYVETLSVGDKVTVEAEYAVDCASPYPAMNVSEAVE